MNRESVIHPLDPIYDTTSRIIILGTMPSKVSRNKGFYYANPTNRFWRVLEGVFEEEIQDKLAFLKKHHIALWDVIHSCDIFGSSDTSIKNVVVNDISSLLSKFDCQAIFFTGKKAYTLFLKYFPDVTIPLFMLPSPSSANAKYHLEDLVREYKIIKKFL